MAFVWWRDRTHRLSDPNPTNVSFASNPMEGAPPERQYASRAEELNAIARAVLRHPVEPRLALVADVQRRDDAGCLAYLKKIRGERIKCPALAYFVRHGLTSDQIEKLHVVQQQLIVVDQGIDQIEEQMSDFKKHPRSAAKILERRIGGLVMALNELIEATCA
jgi:hypothetical protein